MQYNILKICIPRIKDIPIDIWINHIMPYTQSPQPRELLIDIRDYVSSLDEISHFLHYQYRLIRYYITTYPVNYLVMILKRLYMLNTKDDDNIKHIYSNIIQQYNLSTGLLWGLLTPMERARFFNNVILIDE